jgi:putative transposase
MPFCQLYYHLIWATKDRLPLLTPQVEPAIHNYLRAKAIGLGATVFALNGVEDHVHMIASIPPKIAVAKFVGQVKAVASTKFNKSGTGPTPFFWQDEYGAFTFDRKRLPNFVSYVERQKEHHAQPYLIPVLERTNEQPEKTIREHNALYWIEDPEWRRELEQLETKEI